MNPNSVSNYARSGEVPTHLAVIAALLAELRRSVIEFTSTVGQDVLREAHRLAWNFSHSPALITIEPDLVRVWTCCEVPTSEDQQIDRLKVHEIRAELLANEGAPLEQQAARALH